MDDKAYAGKRKSYREVDEVFFWTATINNWQHLLQEDPFEEVVIQIVAYIEGKRHGGCFAFVIMPNHIHLIRRTNALNRKETAHGSFLKFTAHAFKKCYPATMLNWQYAVDAHKKNFDFLKDVREEF